MVMYSSCENLYIYYILIYPACIVHACNEAPCNVGDGSGATAEEMTEPQRLQRNPAYCSIEMMKKTPMTYENVFM